jgi:hypothetical protein
VEEAGADGEGPGAATVAPIDVLALQEVIFI